MPAPGAKRLAPHAAIAETDGVRMTARAAVWNGVPHSLPEDLTPLLVTVTNRSERRIRVAYEGFALVAADGRRYRALAPSRIDRVMTEMVVEPAGAAFLPHSAHWNALGPGLRYLWLPTMDMLRRALPEGLVEPGGEVSGFVYFERLPPGKGRVELRARFPAAEGRRITQVAIPFEVS